MGNLTAAHTEFSIENIRDLGDFCESWPELRSLVMDYLESGAVSDPDVLATMTWLCHLSDRVYHQPPSEL